MYSLKRETILRSNSLQETIFPNHINMISKYTDLIYIITDSHL